MPMIKLTAGNGTTVLVNSDWIAYAVPEGPELSLTIGLPTHADGRPHTIDVKESLDRISDLIRNAY